MSRLGEITSCHCEILSRRSHFSCHGKITYHLAAVTFYPAAMTSYLTLETCCPTTATWYLAIATVVTYYLAVARWNNFLWHPLASTEAPECHKKVICFRRRSEISSHHGEILQRRGEITGCRGALSFCHSDLLSHDLIYCCGNTVILPQRHSISPRDAISLRWEYVIFFIALLGFCGPPYYGVNGLYNKCPWFQK